VKTYAHAGSTNARLSPARSQDFKHEGPQRAPMDQPSPQTFSFEETFEAAEAGIAGALDRLVAAQRSLVVGNKAALVGDVAALSKAVHAARSAVRESEPYLEHAALAVAKDFAQAMRSNEFAREVVAQAGKVKLAGVRLVHGVIFSFPILLSPLPDKLSVRIGKKLLRTLRPSTLVRNLEAQRNRAPSKRYLERVLAAVHEAYLDASQRQYSIAVKITEIHDRLTRLPTQKADYSEIDFISDLYMLERENVLITSTDHVISFPASTGIRGGNVIRITTESGQERVYSSIRFD